MIVEELISKLGLQIDPEAFKTLSEFQEAIHHGLHGITVAAGAAAVAFAALIGETAEAAQQMGHTADTLGENVVRLQELKYAADRNEVSFESLTSGLGFLNKNAREAAEGNKELRAAFGDIKLHGADGKIRGASDLLEDLADRMSKLPDAATRTNYAMKLLGRGGRELIPMLQSSDKLRELIDESHKFGNIFTEEDVKNAREFDEGIKDVRDSLLGLRNGFATQFFEELSPALRALGRFLISLRPYVVKFGLAIRQVAAEFWAVTKPVRMLAGYLADLFNGSVIAKFLKGLDTFSALKALMLGAAVVAGILAAEFVWSAATAIAAWVAAAAPFILLAGLIGLIVDDIYNFIEGNDSMIGRLQKWGEAIGDPDEHPLIKFLRKALALIFDVTDPKHWEQFKEAAGDAVDFLSEKIRLALGGKKFVKVGALRVAEDMLNADGTVKAPEAPQQGGVFGQNGLLDKLGFHRGGFDSVSAYAPQTAPGIHLQGPNFTPGPAAPASVTNHITINGSNLSPEQLQSSVENALNASYSNAQAATSGGEK